jgi:hypothetical protein
MYSALYCLSLGFQGERCFRTINVRWIGQCFCSVLGFMALRCFLILGNPAAAGVILAPTPPGRTATKLRPNCGGRQG